MVKMGQLVAMNGLCWLDILGRDGLDGMWPLAQFWSADWLESQILCLWAALSVAHWSSMCYLVTWLPFVISKDLQLLTLASWNLTVFLVMSLDIITAIAWLEGWCFKITSLLSCIIRPLFTQIEIFNMIPTSVNCEPLWRAGDPASSLFVYTWVSFTLSWLVWPGSGSVQVWADFAKPRTWTWGSL